MMKQIQLDKLFIKAHGSGSQYLGLFAVLCLGVVEALANGATSAADATTAFFNARNCQFVRRSLASKTADRIMSHGTQLQDLFDALPARQAQQEFQRELAEIRSLCLRLLDRHKLVA